MPPFEDKWLIAQSALRYTGALRDPKAWSILDKQLARRPAALDLTMDSIMNGGLGLVGMTVRALGIGAASGALPPEPRPGVRVPACVGRSRPPAS